MDITAPGFVAIGSTFKITVIALDAFDNIATTYDGTAQIGCTDSAATLPAMVTLINGIGTFSAMLNTSGYQTLTATDTATNGIGNARVSIGVATAAAHFTIIAPAGATHSESFDFTVAALDANNLTAVGYKGTVQMSTVISGQIMPPLATLTNGVGVFSAQVNTTGIDTLTATDSANSTITGSSNSITVTANDASKLVISGMPATRRGSAVLLHGDGERLTG